MMNPLKHWNRLQTLSMVALFLAVIFIGFSSQSAFAGGIKLPEIPGLQKIFPPPPDIINNRPSASNGHELLGGAIWAISQAVRFLLGIFAIAFIIWSAILLITAGGKEEQLDKGKRGVTYGMAGLVFALMINTIILDVLYGGRGIGQGTILETPESVSISIDAGTKLTLDAIQWFKGITIIVAVGYILLSGLKMITSLGDTEKISQNRKVALWVGVGIIVILLNDVVVQEVLYPRVLGDDWKVQYNPNSAKGISEAVGLLRYFLQFLAVVAFAAFIYGGSLMVASFGDEERVENSKKILKSAIIGIIVILMSYTVVSTFISGTVGG